jgi:capsular polysaccharide transport system ATP-binding protein
LKSGLALRNATKYFDVNGTRKYIVAGVSVRFPAGEGVGLLGRNGAGKSTVIRIIAGTEKLNRGRVVRESSVSWPLGFSGSFQPQMTGEQNIRFVARIYGVDTEYLSAYVEDFAELGAFFRAPVNTYSSGMKARLAFGVSMGIDFDYYLVDELTAVGDANFKKKSRKFFEDKLGQAGLVMVSHSNGMLRDYCRSGIVLENGEATYFDDIADAIEYHDANMEAR